jgi:hypothetical protein
VTGVARGGVESALRRELRRFPAPARTGTIAKTALALARRLDDPETPAQAAAAVARSLGETLARLHELAPVRTGPDRLDDLRGRRERRKVASS